MNEIKLEAGKLTLAYMQGDEPVMFSIACETRGLEDFIERLIHSPHTLGDLSLTDYLRRFRPSY